MEIGEVVGARGVRMRWMVWSGGLAGRKLWRRERTDGEQPCGVILEMFEEIGKIGRHVGKKERVRSLVSFRRDGNMRVSDISALISYPAISSFSLVQRSYEGEYLVWFG